MFPDLPLAWLQLTREPARLAAAVAGVAFAVLLVFMQLGFSEALYASAVRFTHSSLTKTVEEIFGLPILPTVASSSDLSDLFQPGTLP